MGNPEWSEQYHHIKILQYQDLAVGLKNLGLHPDDMDIVIGTHLHWDHCFNYDLFKKARILVQKDEIRYCYRSPSHACPFYESQLIKMRPPWLKAIEKIELVEGIWRYLPVSIS